MQGIINGYEPYEYGQINLLKSLFCLTPAKFIFALAMIVNKQLRFNPRLSIERDTIAKAKNILGRTSWDRAHSYALNSSAPYFSCNRILREPFYENRWNNARFADLSIFAGNVGSPRKGTHFLLRAVSLLVSEFPNIKLRIAGESPEAGSIKDWKKYIGYPAYIRRLISELKLERHVEFLGVLSAEEMAEQMSETSVFVLSSIIENSPNTLGEAMILGMPCVAAYSGGVGDMAVDYKEALFYRANDPQVLAYKIKTLFSDSDFATRLGKAARVKALATHDPESNKNKLLAAYKSANALWDKKCENE
jgi:glycosyltransferase involved in cell wall biosynthesis